MTVDEAKHKMDFLKKAYQKLIDEKVDSGKLVGDGVMGEWKAETPIDEAYKDMIEALDLVIKVLEQTRWIPMKTREMTKEEKEEIGFDFGYMYDCPLPDDGQEVLITDCYGNVEIDTFCRDYDGVYFEENCDDGEVVAWMPLPQPYKTESEDKK